MPAKRTQSGQSDPVVAVPIRPGRPSTGGKAVAVKRYREKNKDKYNLTVKQRAFKRSVMKHRAPQPSNGTLCYAHFIMEVLFYNTKHNNWPLSFQELVLLTLNHARGDLKMKIDLKSAFDSPTFELLPDDIKNRFNLQTISDNIDASVIATYLNWYKKSYYDVLILAGVLVMYIHEAQYSDEQNREREEDEEEEE